MKSFLKLASVVVFACGIAVSAEGMNNNRRSDIKSHALVTPNRIIMLNDDAANENDLCRVDIVTVPGNPHKTINSLAFFVVPLTFSKNRSRSPSEQLTGAQLVTECVNALISKFNEVQQRLVRIVGQNRVTSLEGADLQIAALLAVDRVYSSH